MMGTAVTTVMSVSFQPNRVESKIEPKMLKSEMRTTAMFMPRSCWSCTGSDAMREVRAPTEFSSESW